MEQFLRVDAVMLIGLQYFEVACDSCAVTMAALVWA